MKKKRKVLNREFLAVVFILALTVGLYIGTAHKVFAQSDFIIYPSEGQSQEQLEQDRFECYRWAVQQTGFDPMETPRATAPPPQAEAPRGGVGRGAVGGALLGAGIGAIAGDTGRGAAIGGLSGGAFGGMRRQDQRRQEQHAEQQWAQDQVNQLSQRRDKYNRAFRACLEGRGYSVM